MTIWEGVRLAWEQIRTQKLKSFFSVLGVVIGVMFLLVVVSVVEGMDRYIKEDFSQELFGINTVTLRRIPEVQVNTSQEEWREWTRRPELTFDDAEALRRQLTLPARVGVRNDRGSEVVGPGGSAAESVQIQGISPEIFTIRNYEVVEGRPFSQQEYDRGVPVVVLGAGTATTLFGDASPVGQEVRIRGFPYRVIGVLEGRGSLFGQSLDNLALAPALSPIKNYLTRPRVVEDIIVQVDDPALVPDLKQEVEGIMRTRRRLRPSENSTFSVETAEESLSFWDRISRVLFLALPALVGISLVVGGIVIMNIMLVSVMERTREIGVRKALGARQRDILVQVLIESATLSGFGALLGVGVGIGLSFLVAAVSPLPAAVAPLSVVVGVGLGVVVGVVSGVYPASRAARLDPVDALRYE